MGIKFRHDAAAVVVPSSASTRKYGQQLALQQQQLKYRAQQEGYDRLFQLGRDAQQNMAQARLQGEQNAAQAIRDAEQKSFVMGRDKAQQEQADKEQRKRDFDAARGRIDAYAKDALNNPDLPHELRAKIQNLISGKMTVLGGGYDGPAQQQFLDQYNSQLAALLSEIPPTPPKPTPTEERNAGIAVGKDGREYQKNAKGVWEEIPQQKQQPMSFDEYFKQEPEKARAALDSKIAEIQKDIDKEDTTLKAGETIEDRAFSELEKPFAAIRKRYGQPPKGYGTSSAAYYNDPKAPSPTAPASEIPVASPDSGIPPSPTIPQAATPTPDAQRAPLPLTSNASSQNQWEQIATGSQQLGASVATDAEATAMGYKLVTPADGSRPYYYKDGTATPAAPPAAPNTQSVRPLDGSRPRNLQGAPTGPLYGEGRDSVPNGPLYGEGRPAVPAGPLSVEEAVAGLPTAQKFPAPDFGNMASNATDDADRGLINALGGIYANQPPDVQAAINVVLSSDATPGEALQAAEYLNSKGIDTNQMSATKVTGGGRRGKSK